MWEDQQDFFIDDIVERHTIPLGVVLMASCFSCLTLSGQISPLFISLGIYRNECFISFIHIFSVLQLPLRSRVIPNVASDPVRQCVHDCGSDDWEMVGCLQTNYLQVC